MATIFEEAQETPPEDLNASFLEKYVGEGKKFSDVEQLAKAYYNADKFIPELKSDHEALKEFVLAQLAERADDSNNRQPNPSEKPNEETPPPPNPAERTPPKEDKEVDLDERIKRALKERDESTRLSENAKI